MDTELLNRGRVIADYIRMEFRNSNRHLLWIAFCVGGLIGMSIGENR